MNDPGGISSAVINLEVRLAVIDSILHFSDVALLNEELVAFVESRLHTSTWISYSEKWFKLKQIFCLNMRTEDCNRELYQSLGSDGIQLVQNDY